MPATGIRTSSSLTSRLALVVAARRPDGRRGSPRRGRGRGRGGGAGRRGSSSKPSAVAGRGLLGRPGPAGGRGLLALRRRLPPSAAGRATAAVAALAARRSAVARGASRSCRSARARRARRRTSRSDARAGGCWSCGHGGRARVAAWRAAASSRWRSPAGGRRAAGRPAAAAPDGGDRGRPCASWTVPVMPSPAATVCSSAQDASPDAAALARALATASDAPAGGGHGVGGVGHAGSFLRCRTRDALGGRRRPASRTWCVAGSHETHGGDGVRTSWASHGARDRDLRMRRGGSGSTCCSETTQTPE